MSNEENVNTLVDRTVQHLLSKVRPVDVFSKLTQTQRGEIAIQIGHLHKEIEKLNLTSQQYYTATNNIWDQSVSELKSDPKSRYAQMTPKDVKLIALNTLVGSENVDNLFKNRNNLLINAIIKKAQLPQDIRTLEEMVEAMGPSQTLSASTLEQQTNNNLISSEENRVLITRLRQLSDTSELDVLISELSNNTYGLYSPVTKDSIQGVREHYINTLDIPELKENSALLRKNPIPLIPVAITFAGTLKTMVVAGLAYVAWDQMNTHEQAKLMDVCRRREEAFISVMENLKRSLQEILKASNSSNHRALLTKALTCLYPTLRKLRKNVSSDTIARSLVVFKVDCNFETTRAGLISFVDEFAKDVAPNSNQGDIERIIPTKVDQLTPQEAEAKLLQLISVLNISVDIARSNEKNLESAAEELRDKNVIDQFMRFANNLLKTATTVFEYAMYSLLGLGILWGGVKVYKTYKNED